MRDSRGNAFLFSNQFPYWKWKLPNYFALLNFLVSILGFWGGTALKSKSQILFVQAPSVWWLHKEWTWWTSKQRIEGRNASVALGLPRKTGRDCFKLGPPWETARSSMRTWNGFRWLSAKEKERKCPLDLSSYPRLHCECWKGFFSCVLQVTTAIISRHITAVIHREFYKGQRDSQIASMVSGTEPITAASGKEKNSQ